MKLFFFSVHLSSQKLLTMPMMEKERTGKKMINNKIKEIGQKKEMAKTAAWLLFYCRAYGVSEDRESFSCHIYYFVIINCILFLLWLDFLGVRAFAHAHA